MINLIKKIVNFIFCAILTAILIFFVVLMFNSCECKLIDGNDANTVAIIDKQ